jgi:hypothetical protein
VQSAAAGLADEEDRHSALLEACRRQFPRLCVDGDGSDWAGWPTTVDNRVNRPNRREVDVTEVGVALWGDDLKVMIRTAGRPETRVPTFQLEVDAWGNCEMDFLVAFFPQGPGIGFWQRSAPPMDGAVPPQSLPVEWSIADVIEVCINLDGVADMKKVPGLDRLFERRGWARVRVVANDTVESTAYYGPTAASFDLEARPGAQSAIETETEGIECPVEGTWLIGNGAFARTHAGRHAYDLMRFDRAFHAHLGSDDTVNERYHAWEEPVLSPIAGIAVVVEAGHADQRPTVNPMASPSNAVHIRDSCRSLRVVLGHLRERSAAIGVGARVGAGTMIARVGNSGKSGAPHLHLEAVRDSDGVQDTDGQSVPLALKDVWVGLNMEEVDPWWRFYERWPIEEGFFVRGTRPWHATARPDRPEEVTRGKAWRIKKVRPEAE